MSVSEQSFTYPIGICGQDTEDHFLTFFYAPAKLNKKDFLCMDYVLFL